MKKSFLVIILLLFCFTNGYAQNGWVWQNPRPTGTYLKSLFFIDNNIGVIVGGGGSILRTTDNGVNWVPQKSNTNNYLNSVYFSDSNTGFAAGNGGTILRTTNQGIQWDVLPSGVTTDLNSVYFFDSNTGWAVGKNGVILKTTNKGNTWISQTSGQGVPLNGVFFKTASLGWISAYYTILKTTNGGTTWIAQPGTMASTNSIFFSDENNGCAVGSGGVALYTTDGGTTWKNSTYYGSNSFYSVSFINRTQGWAVGSLGITTTSDGGVNWTEGYRSDKYLSSILFKNGTGWVVGQGGTILKLTADALNWNKITIGTGAELNSIFFINSLKGWAAGSLIIKTTDGGTTWSEKFSVPNGTNYPMYSIYFIDENIGWTGGLAGITYKTTNGGDTWTEVNLNTNNASVYAIYFLNSNIGWALCQGSLIRKTIDGGSTWISQSISSVNARSIHFPEQNNGFMADGIGIIRTTDGGLSWVRVYSGINSFYSLFFLNKDVGWAVGTENIIIKTTDGGLTWNTQTSPAGEYTTFKSVRFVDANTGYAAGSSGIILKTTDGGGNWNIQSSGASNNFNALWIKDANTGWVVGSDMVVLKTTNGGVLANEKNNFKVPTEYSLTQNYPNPFNPTTTIKYKVKSVETLHATSLQRVSLKVFDLIGREIAVLVNEDKNPGEYSVVFNAKDLTSGVYYYQMTTSSTSETKKMILIK